MLKTLKKHIDSQLPFLNNSKLLIAVSGGVDSVVLTHLCHKLNLNIALAHCNFNLRGDESNEDEDFVIQLADTLNLEVFVESFDTQLFAESQKVSIQMAARELRYNWFEELATQLSFDYILTAHHTDDNIETFLINLGRGSGLDGLIGIPEQNNIIVRPLLNFSRDQLVVFAKTNHIKWREDSSNESNKYMRNKIRNEVLPILKEIHPHLIQNFNTSISHLKDSKLIIEDSIAKLQKKVVFIENDIIKLDIEKLKKLSNTKAYLYELLKEFNFTEWNDITDLLFAQSGKQIFSSTHRLIKDRDFLLLSAIQSDVLESVITIDENCEKTHFNNKKLLFNTVKETTKSNLNKIYVDKEKLQYPLILRLWSEGDIFFPKGMSGKKKLSKYFKDEKLSLLEKEQMFVLCSGEAIVWVIGKRQDRRFEIDEKTKSIVKIEIK